MNGPENLSDLFYGFFDAMTGFFVRVAGSGVMSSSAPAAPVESPPVIVPIYVTDVPPLIFGNDQLEMLGRLWEMYVPISIFVTLLFGAGVIYALIRVWQIRAAEEELFRKAAETVRVSDEPRTKLRWDRVMDQLKSDDEHNWRLAILEADIMLNELLDVLGYKGETMADKMKQADRARFRTIDQAWEAHKARNRVAHEGSEYALSRDEAERVIGKFARVFREFKLIE